MSGQFTERPNNTDEQVREYLEKAVALADELTGRDERWPVVFEQALSLVSGKQILMAPIAPSIPAMMIPGKL